MKRMKRLIAFVAVVLGMSMTTWAQNAQNGFSLRTGGSFPVNFLDKDGGISGITFDNAATTFGDAAMGWNAGLKFQFKLLGSLSMFASADVFYSDVTDEYTGLLDDLGLDLNDLGVDENMILPLCLNAPVLVGLNWQIINLKIVQLWAEAGVGVNFHSVFSLDEEDVYFERSLEADDLYRTAAAVAWQAGAGITLGGKVSLGVHYYAFGNSDVNTVDDWADKLAGEFESGKVNPSMMVLRLGYHF